jgi:hypothetical protein
MGFYIPEDGILHSHCRENLKSYTVVLSSIYVTSGCVKYVEELEM